MQTRCPCCRQKLLLCHRERATPFLCPFCGTTFRLPPGGVVRQLLLAVDVSTSAAPYLAAMQRELVQLRASRCDDGKYQVSTYTFHHEMSPFPCEQLGRPRCGELAIVPTLRDLRGRVAAGSAVLDTLYRLLTTAESLPATSRELVLLTDGQDRDSRRHPEEVRRRIERAAADTTIRILGFAGASGDASLCRFMRRVSASRVMWSFFSTCVQDSVREILLFPKSNSEPSSRGRTSCCV